MPYIGNTVQNQGFTPAIDYFSGNGVTVTFTLSRPVVSASQVICAVDNVIQNPSSAFTVSGSSITFTSAPLSGTNNIWVEYTSLITTYNAISQDPSVIGDITASGGYLSTGDFGNSYIDGTIVDYVTGNARITTGPADGLTIYNGGTSARNALLTLNTNGALGVGTSPSYGSSGQYLQSTGSSTPPTWATVASSQWTTTGSDIYYNTGNVGIGTSSPSTKLSIGRVDSSSEGGQVDLCRASDNANAWGIDVYGSTSTPSLRILDNTAAAARMVIDGSGNVGVGTSSPASKLDIQSSTDALMHIKSGSGYTAGLNIMGNNATVDSNNVLLWQGSSNECYLYNRANNFIAFGTNNTERARIDSAGLFKFNSGYGSVATAYGCRAWVNFAGSSASIRGSGNVSSISRLGGGIYTINMTNALVDANYAVCGSCSTNGTYGIVTFYANSNNNTVVTPTTTAFTVSTGNPSIGNFDSTYVMISVFR